MLSGRMPADSFFSILTTGNLFFLGLSFLLTLIGAFFFIMYATLFVGQNDGMEPRDSFKKCVSALPRFLLLLLLLALLSAVSACLAFFAAAGAGGRAVFSALESYTGKSPFTCRAGKKFSGFPSGSIFYLP
ncbi:MAG: hypothetical protein ACOX1A_05645 [Saccharofermentanales bacterium]